MLIPTFANGKRFNRTKIYLIGTRKRFANLVGRFNSHYAIAYTLQGRISSLSSSRHAKSTYSLDSLSLSLSLSLLLSLSLTHTHHLYKTSPLISCLDGTQYPRRADECKVLLVDQTWLVDVLESIGEWGIFYSSYVDDLWDRSKCPYSCCFYFATPMIWINHHAAYLCTSQPIISWESSWCNHTVVIVQWQID